MPAKPKDSLVFQLKVTLRYSKPPIWRRIQVRSDVTLHQLHRIIQIAMGWTNSHMHQFIAFGEFYGEPEPEFDFDVKDERRVRLNQIVTQPKDAFIYEYDFGDGWEHEIVLEKILEPEQKASYPRCIKGKRNCPPEDVGGVWGYEGFLEAIGDADHPEHEEYVEWIGGSFDPEAFDLEEVNEELELL